MATPLTFQEFARVALQSAPVPMSSTELWAHAEQKGITTKLPSAGKTPWHSMGALLYVDTKENLSSDFLRVGRRPVRFWLRTRPLPKGWTAAGPTDEAKVAAEPEPEEHKERRFLEKDLHPMLTWFARTQLDGVRVKTIRHSASTKKAFGEWVHPDILGVRFPLSALGERITVEFAGAVRAPIMKVFSFELKRSVDFSSLRECFFQAVSNSSWAHEGYLVAAKWLDDDEFSEELSRLSQSFGIGAIHLNLDEPSASRVIHAARPRAELDWVTLDKLVAMNPDVAQFLESVRIDLNANKIHDGEYDAPPTDIDEYLRAHVPLDGAKAKKARQS